MICLICKATELQPGQAWCPDCTHEIDTRASDPVRHPAHYRSHPSGIECIEITRWMGFNIGNVIKYLWRADEKGSPIEDLEKASWYLNDEITRRKGMQL